MTYGNKVLILIAIAASPLPANAQEQYASAKPTIIPRPAQMELGDGSFELKPATSNVADAAGLRL